MKAVFALLAVVLVSNAIAGESLADKKYWKEQMDYVTEKSLNPANEKCGVKFTFEWMNRDEVKKKVEAQSGSPYGMCSSIIDEVWHLCNAGDDEKKAVVEKIKGFKCGWADKRTLAIEKKIVVYKGNNTESNFSDWAKPWLMKNL